MKSISRAAAAAVVVFALASPCWAGQVRLEIRDGLVTLSAKDASVREILAEWARVGQTRIVNAERVPYGQVTMELDKVPEAKALDILLRSVAGYLAAPRAASLADGSRYDRIMIMAVARPAAGGPAPPAAAGSITQPVQQRRMYQPQPSLMVDDQDEPVVQPQPQPQPQQPPPGSPYPGASQPGVVTPAPTTPYQYPQGQQPGMTPGAQQPGMAQPGAQPGATSPAVARPGMTTPGKPPGTPGGPGGN